MTGSQDTNKRRKSALECVRPTCYWTAVAVIALTAAEIGSRLNDQLQVGTPFSHTPNQDRDLFIVGPHGERRGRPNGAYRHWQLNSLGLRGPEVREYPAPGTARILVLGSSEAFGLYELPGNEFPARLHAEFHTHGIAEVLNGSLPGMTLDAMAKHYQHWSSSLGAQYVIIYPNALFYLNVPDSPRPKAAKPSDANSKPKVGPPAAPSPRILWHLRDVVDMPQWLVDYRDQRQLVAIRERHNTEWIFRSVPEIQLRAFQNDLDSLLSAILEHQAIPILATHARRIPHIEHQGDYDIVARGLIHTPRATPEVCLGFASAANAVIRDTAHRLGLICIDLDASLSGQPGLFADLVHFTDKGAAAAAQLISARVEPLLERQHVSIPDAVQ